MTRRNLDGKYQDINKKCHWKAGTSSNQIEGTYLTDNAYYLQPINRLAHREDLFMLGPATAGRNEKHDNPEHEEVKGKL